ncbi:MAG TPA: group I intron-associated PD-(D/E)XK endonuclease [Pyrinomonadaceae bacterium]|jgi:hypothetical protein|nr:group I intron-associated PD-(D/E)XK endonuclease [Pyrinomonadaceae bacterium]
MHEKKTIGDLSVVRVIARLTELQWNVGILITEHAKYDLLAEKRGKMIRVQVKTGRVRNGGIRVQLRSIWSDKNGCHVRTRREGDYDVLAIHCPESSNIYFLMEDCLGANTSEVNLRLSVPKNNQTKRVHLADNHLLI